MTSSLGKSAYVGRLVADSIEVKNEVNSSHKVIGSEMNEGSLHHVGSIFFVKWSAIHQINEAETQNGTSSITYTTNAAHGLDVGDTVHINSSFGSTSVAGIPLAELTGTKVVTAVDSVNKKFTVATITQANDTGNESITPLVRVDRYKYIDLNTNVSTWNSSSTEPAPGHTNSEVFYL